MDENRLTTLLTRVREGHCSIAEALVALRHFPSENLPNICLDHQRQLRTGIPEVIYGAGKSADQIATIAKAMMTEKSTILATRVTPEKAHLVQQQLTGLSYHAEAGMLTGNERPVASDNYHGPTLVVCAGTSDLGVAEEARVTLTTFGHPTASLYDAGVAGLHRLLNRQQALHEAATIIVVAGMEGALPSVVAGLTCAPVIAVPTSVGYGASFNGLAALLGMLNSCAPGVAVVNIDNGFGAACMAEAINRKRQR